MFWEESDWLTGCTRFLERIFEGGEDLETSFSATGAVLVTGDDFFGDEEGDFLVEGAGGDETNLLGSVTKIYKKYELIGHTHVWHVQSRVNGAYKVSHSLPPHLLKVHNCQSHLQ